MFYKANQAMLLNQHLMLSFVLNILKTVTVHLPWSMRVQIAEVSVDDGAFVEAVKGNGKKILFYGDSITQGYDAMRPSNRYAGKVAEMLGFEDPLYFSKKFRAYYGVSPSEYRKSGIAE